MDEGLGDEAAAVDTVDGKYLRGKDVMVGTHEMITPDEGQYRHGSSPAFATVLEGKNPDIDGVSQHVYASPHCTEDAGVMVEELTLRNYNGKSLAVLGTSKSREMMQARKNQWPHLYQTGSGGSGEDAQYGQASSHAWEDDGYTAFSELFSQKPQDDTHNDNLEHPPNNENKPVASSMSTPPGVFRTKILSNSGFSKYFVKNTLKGKGVVFKGSAREGFGGEFRGQTNLKAFNTPKVAFDAPLSSSAKMVVPPACGAGHGVSPSLGEEFRGQTNPKAVNTLKVAFDAPLSPSAKMVVPPACGAGHGVSPSLGEEFRGQTNPKAVNTLKVAFDAPLSPSAKMVMPPACGAGYGVGPSLGEEFRGQTNPKAVNTPKVAFDAPLSLGDKMVAPPACGAGHGVGPSLDAFNGGVNLREWMTSRLYKANKVESLYIFRQIVDFVDFSHSQGLALLDLRPSLFKLLPSNHVIYLGSSTQQDVVLNLTDQDNLFSENDRNEKRLLEQPLHPSVSQMVKKQKFGENLNLVKQRSQFSSRSGFKAAVATNSDLGVFGPQDSWNDLNIQHYMKREYKSEGNSSSSDGSNAPQLLSTCTSDPLEEKWYTSPEELSGRGCTFSSNIYALGVLLFELLGLFDSERERASAMSDLCYRIFPPNFLSENPREAAFCLRLLHPEPSLRLSVRKVLQSDIVKGIGESFGDELSSCMREDDTESELLLHFLLSLKEEKQKDALKLVEEIKFLETDIQEVERRQVKQPLVLSGSSSNPLHFGSELHSKLNLETNTQMRFMENISPLESAYFSTRSNIQLFDDDVATRTNKELLEERGDEYWAQKDEGRKKPRDHLGTFFSGLCKYARYSKFEVRGILRNGDFHNSANVICSLSFDRDQEYFAAAGVSKRIKIYDFQALFNETVDFHYPANEMSNKSKLSCICWNSYIRNYLASTDYDGIVKLWDAGTGQDFSQYIEHNKRAWSVDFSQVDPTKFASGSDDCSVKVWNINERNSLCTIRNIANICCVQFSSHSSHLLAFGSSDYKTYCYDLRNVSSPWCVLAGHEKAVSYVKFLDSETLVSASTDNTLKLWDLNTTSSTSQSTTSIVTLEGHTNEKNFVGLSVADGYIACGSETNEVYAYYRSLPMPITSYKFGSINPISGKETDDDDGQFVSSVCWRKNSDMLVVANSTGCIKVLQMV